MAASIDTAPLGAMEEATAPMPLKPLRVIHYKFAIPGGFLGVIVLATVSADVWTNGSYAWKMMGPGAAIIAVTFAVLVGFLPVMARMRGGWSRGMKGAQGACVLATVLFAVCAYGERQAERIGIKEAAGQSLGDAEQSRIDARTYREQASVISETASVSSLASLEASARDTFASAGKASAARKLECVDNRKCRDAKAALDRIIERKGQAEAKASYIRQADEAQAKADAYRTDARQTGSAKATALASMVGPLLQIAPTNAEQGFNFILLIVTICGTLSIAFLGEEATDFLMKAVDEKSVALQRQELRVATRKLKALEPKPEPALPFDAAREYVATLVPSDVLIPAGEVEKHLKRWMTVNHPGKVVPGRGKVKNALIAAGHNPIYNRGRKGNDYPVRLPDIEPALKVVAA